MIVFAACLGAVDMRQDEVRVSISEEAASNEGRTGAVGAPSLRGCLSSLSRTSQSLARQEQRLNPRKPWPGVQRPPHQYHLFFHTLATQRSVSRRLATFVLVMVVV